MNRRHLALALALAAALVPLAPLAAATETNRGTIKVHDTDDVEPSRRNQPHVDCEFWVEGFGMADSSGTLVFTAWAPTGDKETVVLAANWSADRADPAHHFEEGPFTLPAGHYRVEAYSATGHPGGNPGHFAKAKMFWVEPCEPAPPTPPPPPLACPTDLRATANAGGTITLFFTPAPGSDGTNIYRLDAEGDFELLATLPPGVDMHTDETTEAGTAYTYAVTALFGDRESQECPIVEVTAIPEFPTAIAFGLAAALGVVAYAAVRRRNP